MSVRESTEVSIEAKASENKEILSHILLRGRVEMNVKSDIQKCGRKYSNSDMLLENTLKRLCGGAAS